MRKRIKKCLRDSFLFKAFGFATFEWDREHYRVILFILSYKIYIFLQRLVMSILSSKIWQAIILFSSDVDYEHFSVVEISHLFRSLLYPLEVICNVFSSL